MKWNEKDDKQEEQWVIGIISCSETNNKSLSTHVNRLQILKNDLKKTTTKC